MSATPNADADARAPRAGSLTGVVEADGNLQQRLVSATPARNRGGLSSDAFARFDTAQSRTVWGRAHRRHFALMQGTDILAGAEQYDLRACLDRQPIVIRAIGGAFSTRKGDVDPRHDELTLVERLVLDASIEGVDLALFFRSDATTTPIPPGFAAMPVTDVRITVAEPARYGAPMILVRGGEDRDLAAIEAMGRATAVTRRFHLDRNADFLKHTIVRKRSLAGLSDVGTRQLEFVIAEEGTTAAAYLVISVADGGWTIEACGDRDATGARLGALLQAMIAREPSRARPVITGWLPPGLLPPQVTVSPVTDPPSPAVFMRPLSVRMQDVRLTSADVLYWRSDVF